MNFNAPDVYKAQKYLLNARHLLLLHNKSFARYRAGLV